MDKLIHSLISDIDVQCSGTGIVTRSGEVVYDNPPVIKVSQVTEIRVMKDDELIAVLKSKVKRLFEGSAIASAHGVPLYFGVIPGGMVAIEGKINSDRIYQGDWIKFTLNDNEENLSGQPSKA